MLGRLRARLGGRVPRFATSDVRIGEGVRFGQDVVFTGRRVRIGDGVVFRDHVRVEAESFEIGDFGTIYDYCFFPGPGTLRIGHNFWMGNGAIVDAMGGTEIDDNVCIGVRAQLWTHMRFGDVLYGCRFDRTGPMRVERDAWIGAACLVSPVHVGARSLALGGAVVTRDMAPDRTYAGVPATDVTDKVGPQFDPRPLVERASMLRARLDAFAQRRGTDLSARVRVVTAPHDAGEASPDVTVFNVDARTYTKRGTELERDLMRYLLPDAKFVPATAPSAS